MRALITGVAGQDGHYLAKHLGALGWDVVGMMRGRPTPAWDELREELPHVRLVEGDLLDQSSLRHALAAAAPDVVFNLGAITYVGRSWAQPALMSEVTGLGVLRLLEEVRAYGPVRVVHASSSEMFGGGVALNEQSRLNPRSPYGVAKAFAHHTTVNYRESYGMHVSTAIMFNHESPRRGLDFVTRRVSHAVAAIANGKQSRLHLGNLAARRDWGWAPEYMTALPLIAAQDEPGDYVIATGETHSVEELCAVAFSVVGLNAADYVISEPARFRPADVEVLLGDASKATEVLGFTPRVRFHEIVEQMVKADLDAYR